MKQERSSKVVGDTEEDKETSANVRNKAKHQQAFGLEQVNFCCHLWTELSLGVNTQNNFPRPQDMGRASYHTKLGTAESHLIRGKGEGPIP